MDYRHQANSSSLMTSGHEDNNHHTSHNQVLLEFNVKPGLEKTDSCYDSDDHDEDNTDVARSVRSFNHEHRDVSRTVSETLKEEYDQDGSHFPLDPDLYRAHLAFALKLGYTEQQVQQALLKLGTPASENAFLAELITLGAATTAMEDEAAGARAGGGNGGGRSGLACSSGSESPAHRRCSPGGGGGGPGGGGEAKCANNPSSGDMCSPSFLLRHIVIDGSNVAMSHGNKSVFSCRGIQLCVEYFKQRGHTDITVFVPQWRKEASKPDAPIKDQDILLQLEREGRLTFTPSRYVGQRRVVCYDDRYIIKLALETEGVIVSNDSYRDLVQENVDYRRVVESHLLMYSFVNDRFMPPDDPLGRHGPSLNQFLRKNVSSLEYHTRPCPYGKKCTYGNKCKFAHPERSGLPQQSVTEKIAERAKIQLHEIKEREIKCAQSKPKLTATLSSPVRPSSAPHRPVSRTRSMVPGAVQEPIGNPRRTISPLATTSAHFQSPSPGPASAVGPHSHHGSGLFDHNIVSNVDRLFLGEDHFRPPFNNPPQPPRFFSPAESSFETGQYPVAPRFLSPRPAFSLPANPAKALEISHRHVSQTHSDPFSAPRLPPGGHLKLQRQLSLNPYASQSCSDTAQFFTQSARDAQLAPAPPPPPPPPADNFFTPSSFLASDAASRAETFFAQPRAVPQANFLPGTNLSFHDSRRIDLFDRLSCLFPEEKVRYAMSCYPQEYNVEKLCAAILKIFPAEDN